METKWLEDFVSLAETRSFSRSAALRHVTQPAFSRRIQALEAWLGAELIDRSAYPTRLTPAGNIFHAQALTMLNQTREARTLLRGQGAMSAAMIDFAVPHTLSLTFFPRWIQWVEERLSSITVKAADGTVVPVCPGGRLHARLRALNVHDAVLMLAEGGCDLIMGYHHPSYPVALDPRRYAFISLGTEHFSPFCAPIGNGDPRPRFSLPGEPTQAVPYLAYSSDAYLGRMTEVLLMRVTQGLFLDRVYETDMAEGLKSMALAGHGIAFLPHSAVADALNAGKLARLGLPMANAGSGIGGSDSDSSDFTLGMEIRLYRDKLAEVSPARSALIDAVWTLAQSGEHVI